MPKRGQTIKAVDIDNIDPTLRAWVQSFGLGGYAKQVTADLNTITETGFYNTYGSANRPGTANGHLLVIVASATYVTQFFVPHGLAEVYQRTNNNGTWTAWSQLETTVGAQSKASTAETNAINFAKGYGLGDYSKLLAGGTNLDTLQTNGFYRINAGVNVPPRVPNDNTGIWHYLLVIGHDTSWTVQIAWEYSTGTQFIRRKGGSTWSAWLKVITDDMAATTSAAGIVQLSTATNSTSTTLAATASAVKAAYDLANGKWTAVDGTTGQKGIVQLSSATNSTSTTLAATASAVKAAYDLANGKATTSVARTTNSELRVEVLTADPASPAVGRMWLRSDL